MTAWPWRGAPPADDAAVRRRLLPLTLAWARRAPYYRAAWGRRWARGLAALPTLTKAEAVEHAAGLLAVRPGPFVGVVSSGTQSGDREPLRVPEAEAEREALAEFLAARAPEVEAPADGLHLELVSMQHGFPEGAPAEGTLRVPWTPTRETFELLARLLLEPQAGGRRVTSLVAGAAALPPLTAWLWEQEVDFSRLRVRTIGTTGFRLGPHWRARVEGLWGARVFDTFSLSELAVPAGECEACGFHHFAWPAVVTEVLHPRTRAPLRRGTGVLVLTTLWPFVQAMPLIRYWTGDLVELGPRCDARGERGFRFRGRLAQCALTPEGALLLSPQDVEALLDGEPAVARLPHPAVQLGLVQSPDVGVPRFEVQGARRRGGRVDVEVRVEVRYAPAVFPREAAALRERLEVSLRSGSPALRRARLRVTVVGPGSLSRAWSKF